MSNVSFSTSGKPTEYSNQIDLLASVDVETATAILTRHQAQVDANVSPERLRLYYTLKGSETVPELRERDHLLRLELADLGLFEPALFEHTSTESEIMTTPTPTSLDLLHIELIAHKTAIAETTREIADLEHALQTTKAKLQASVDKVAVYEDVIGKLRA